MIETIQHADGRVELNVDAEESIRSSPLYNEDLAPVHADSRFQSIMQRLGMRLRRADERRN